MNKSLIKLTAATTLLTLVGCTDLKPLQADIDGIKAQVGRLQTEIDAVKASSDAAQRAASNAQASANQAAQAASNAQRTANQALAAANAAQQSDDAINEKLGRMFKKSVSK